MAYGSITVPPPPTPITIGGATKQVQPAAGQGYGSISMPPAPTPITIPGASASPSNGPTPGTYIPGAGIAPDPNAPTPGKASLANVGYNLSKLPSQAYNAITSIFPGAQLGNAVGTSLNGLYQSIKQGSMAPINQANQENNSNFSKVVGDTANAVVTPATFALGAGEGSTVAGRVANAALKYGAGGFTSGVASDAAQGDTSASGLLTAGAKGGLLGAGAGAGGQAIGEATSALTKNNSLQTLVNKLLPNTRATGPEVRAAMDEGRIIDGTKSTFWGSTPDVIAPRDKTIINAQTLQKNIPGISDMTPQNMVRAIDNKTDSLAEGLQPVMKNTPITQADTGKVVDAWKQLKATQAEVPAFLDAPSNAKFQSQFERYLGNLQWDISGAGGKFKTPTPKTLDDIWQTQKEYDASVPDDVKNLGPNADRVDKLQNKMWLQNRTLLTSLRDDLAARLAPDVQQTFKDMSNMYDARRGIVKNAKIDVKGSQGLLTKGLIKGAGLVGTGLGLGTGAGLLGEHLLNQPSQ